MYVQGWCITDKEIVYIGYHASWTKLNCIGTKLNAHFYKWYESLRTFPYKGIKRLDQRGEKLKRDYFQVLPLTCCLQRTLILRERLALVFLLVHSITAWQQSCGSGEALCGTGFEAPVVAPGGHNSPPSKGHKAPPTGELLAPGPCCSFYSRARAPPKPAWRLTHTCFWRLDDSQKCIFTFLLCVTQNWHKVLTAGEPLFWQASPASRIPPFFIGMSFKNFRNPGNSK